MAGHYVRSAILVGSIPVLEEFGTDAVALARELGLDPATLTDPDIPVPVSLLLDFYEAAARVADCPTFGLRMAARTGMTVVGPLWVLLRQARTLREMAEDLASHFDLYTSAAIVKLRPIGKDALLTWGAAADIERPEVQMAEFSIAVICGELRRYAPSGWEPASVRFRHSAPKDRAPLRRVFGSHLAFDQPENGILIDSKVLDLPLQNSGSRTRTLLSHVLRHEGGADPGLVARADAVVRAMLPYSRCTLQDVSRALSIAPRTLQERLQAQGSSFQKIRDAARAELAARYLRDSRMSLSQIADVLGFAELAVFSRCFRRWHGTTARAWRAAARSSAT
jgi:AraC-like DNA-binding protein